MSPTEQPDREELAHHYRDSWEWDDDVMPTAADRLERWRTATEAGADVDEAEVLGAVRARLDDDLDTPGALAAIDAAVSAGGGVRRAARLVGVAL